MDIGEAFFASKRTEAFPDEAPLCLRGARFACAGNAFYLTSWSEFERKTKYDSARFPLPSIAP
jgi:hypothetical protein